jgi:hypothetical protein
MCRVKVNGIDHFFFPFFCFADTFTFCLPPGKLERFTFGGAMPFGAVMIGPEISSPIRNISRKFRRRFLPKGDQPSPGKSGNPNFCRYFVSSVIMLREISIEVSMLGVMLVKLVLDISPDLTGILVCDGMDIRLVMDSGDGDIDLLISGLIDGLIEGLLETSEDIWDGDGPDSNDPPDLTISDIPEEIPDNTDPGLAEIADIVEDNGGIDAGL